MGCYWKMKLNWSITRGNHAWLRNDRGTGQRRSTLGTRWVCDLELGVVSWCIFAHIAYHASKSIDISI
jgi:hypothetical protein